MKHKLLVEFYFDKDDTIPSYEQVVDPSNPQEWDATGREIALWLDRGGKVKAGPAHP